MSSRHTTGRRRLSARMVPMIAVVALVAACQKEAPPPAQPGETPAATAAERPAAPAVADTVAAMSVEDLRTSASTAYRESRLYAPAGDNALEYYLALRDKQPGDAGVSSALIDLLPMTVIATEQSRDREDFVEARRLLALVEKANENHPALARLKQTVETAEANVEQRAEQQRLTAEEQAQRQQQLAQEREQQQRQAQEEAAKQLAQQEATNQEAARQEAARQEAARQEAARQEAARQEAAREEAARQEAARPAAPAAAAAAPQLRAISTPAPRFPPEALRAGTSGEVQVEFTVAVDGSVSNARVVRADPPRVFDREALSAVRRWRFEPVSEPVTTRRTIGFQPGG